MSVNAPYVVRLRDCRLDSLSQVGAKNAALGEMSNAGIPIPGGFAVTTRAYEDVCGAAGIRQRIDDALAEVDSHDVSTAEKAGEAIRELITSIALPQRLDQAIRSAYRTLAREYDLSDIPVAVRSSATAEDAPQASFAGQHETFLSVRGADGVITKFKACLSSLFTPRAICYRMKMGLGHREVFMSVGVQKMVNARVAGVLLTLNPANGDLSKVLVEANWGLGTSVVSGEITPDCYVVDKVAFEIGRRVISRKTVEYVLEPNTREVVSRNIPADRQNVPCLQDAEILTLARLGKMIEGHYGTPQNIEWAIDKDLPSPANIAILQSRPETAWSQKTRGPVSARKASILEHMIDTLKEGRRLR